jgi:mono/diheme cytochrome c family protein
MQFRIFFSLIALGIIGLACNSGRSDSTVVAPKLSSIQQEIFDANCNAPSCHGSGMKGGLSLTAGNSYRQLIGVAGAFDKKNIPAILRVKPGTPDSSLLFIKITSPDTSEGELMPKGNDRLSQNKIDAIRQWILDGAPDN